MLTAFETLTLCMALVLEALSCESDNDLTLGIKISMKFYLEDCQYLEFCR